MPGDVGEPLEQRAPGAPAAGVCRHDERTHFAGERRRVVDTVTLEPPLDLTDRPGAAVRDEMHVATEDGLAATHAGILGEPLRELLVDLRVTRARVAPPGLVRVPELAPQARDGVPFVGVRCADRDRARLHHGGHGSPASSGIAASMCWSVRPWAGAV